MNSIARPPSICKRNLEFSLNFMIPPAQRQRRRTCSVFSARRVLSLAANEREPILPNNRNFVNRLAGKNRRCKRRCQRKNDGIPRQRIPTEKRVQATINTALFPPSCWLFSHGKNVSESALSSRPEPLKKRFRSTSERRVSRRFFAARMCGNPATGGSEKATPKGVFDKTRKRPVRGLGRPQQAAP